MFSQHEDCHVDVSVSEYVLSEGCLLPLSFIAGSSHCCQENDAAHWSSHCTGKDGFQPVRMVCWYDTWLFPVMHRRMRARGPRTQRTT